MTSLLARAAPLALAASTTACAGVVGPAIPLPATPLLGPYGSRDAACAALSASATREGWRASTCNATPIDVGVLAPLAAAFLVVRDTTKPDPRLAGSGAVFLGLSAGAAWFLPIKPLDQPNGAAGHTYLPALTVERVRVVERKGGDARVLFRLRDATESVCDVCEGAEHDKRTPVETRVLVTVCGRVGSGKPECTAPISVSAGADVSLEDDTLTVKDPGKPRATYALTF